MSSIVADTHISLLPVSSSSGDVLRHGSANGAIDSNVNATSELGHDLGHDDVVEEEMKLDEPKFHHACRTGNTDTVKIIVACDGLDVNVAYMGTTPLFIACENGNTDIVALVLACVGIDLNLRTPDGRTALYVACKEGHMEIVKLLVADLGMVEIIKQLQTHGTDATTNGTRIILNVLEVAKTIEIKELLVDTMFKRVDDGADVDEIQAEEVLDPTPPIHGPYINCKNCGTQFTICDLCRRNKLIALFKWLFMVFLAIYLA